MAEIKKNQSKLYNALKGAGFRDLGSEEQFAAKLQDANNRQKLYKALQGRGFSDLGDYDTFEKRIYDGTSMNQPGLFTQTMSRINDAVQPSKQAVKEEKQPIQEQKQAAQPSVQPRTATGGGEDGYTFTEQELESKDAQPTQKGTVSRAMETVRGHANPTSSVSDADYRVKAGKKGVMSPLVDAVHELRTGETTMYQQDAENAQEMAKIRGLAGLPAAERRKVVEKEAAAEFDAEMRKQYSDSELNAYKAQVDKMRREYASQYAEEFEKQMPELQASFKEEKKQLDAIRENDARYNPERLGENYDAQLQPGETMSEYIARQERRKEVLRRQGLANRDADIDKEIADIEAEEQAMRQRYQQAEWQDNSNKWGGATGLLMGMAVNASTNPAMAMNQSAMQQLHQTYNPYGLPTKAKDPMEDVLAARRKMAEDTKDFLEDVKRDLGKDYGVIKGLGRSIQEVGETALDLNTWDYGASDLKKQMAVSSAAAKFVNGEKLDPNEQKLLDLVALNTYLNGQYKDDISGWTNAGMVTGEALPFMLEMFLNPASGMGKAVTKGAMKLAVKRYGLKWVKDHAKTMLAKRIVARGIGDVLGATTMSMTTGLNRVAADYRRRLTGDVVVDQDEKGNVIFNGVKDAESPGAALFKAIGSQTIENWSEMAGEYLGFINSFFGKVAGKSVIGKAGRKMLAETGSIEGVSLNKAQKFIYDLAMNKGLGAFNKGLGEFMKKTKWNGVTDEYLEEVIGNIVNAATVGDMTFDTAEGTGVFNLQQNIDTFCGVALLGGFMSAAKTAGYAAHKYVYNVDRVSEANEKLFGSEAWESVKAMIDNAHSDPRELNDALTYLLRAKQEGSKNDIYNNEEKKAILKYTQAVMEQEGAEMAHYQPRMYSSTVEEVQGEDGSKQYVVTSLDKNGEAISQQSFDNKQDADAYKGELQMQQQQKDYKDYLDMTTKLSFAEGTQIVDEFLAQHEGMDEEELMAEMNDAQSEIGQQFRQFRNERAIQKAQANRDAIAAFEEENGWSAGTVKWLAEQDPMQMDATTLAMADEARLFLEGLAYPANEVHVEHSREKGAEVAQNIVEEVDSQEAIQENNAGRALYDRYTAAEQAYNELLDKNENLKQEINTRQGTHSEQEIISSLDTFSPEEVQTVIDYYNARAAYNGFKDEAGKQIDNAARRNRDRHTFKGTINGVADPNNLMQITDADGNVMTLVSGNVTTDVNGVINGSDSGLMIAIDVNGDFRNLGTDAEGGYTLMPVTMTLDQYEESERVRMQEQVTEAVVGPENAIQEEPQQPIEQEQAGAEAGDTKVTGADEAPAASALERIPKDEKGNPIYEQGTPEDTYDALVEQVGDQAPVLAKKQLEAAQKRHDKLVKALNDGKIPGNTLQEQIEGVKAMQADIAAEKERINFWNKVLAVPNNRALDEANTPPPSNNPPIPPTPPAGDGEPNVPDWSVDKASDARARGYRMTNGHRVNRQEPIDVEEGMQVEVKFDKNEEPAKGKLVVVESNSLVPSHVNGQRNVKFFIDEAQPKDRTDLDSDNSSSRIAANVNPEEITGGVTAYTGSPVINARGEVIQGNNRTIGLQKMWGNSQYEQSQQRYKQYLIDHAAEFGLDPADIEKMKSPVLVRMIEADDNEAIRLGQKTAANTESGGYERIDPLRTIQAMGEDIRIFINKLFGKAVEDQTLMSMIAENGVDVLKWMNDGKVHPKYISDTQYQSCFDKNGNLSEEAKTDLKKIVENMLFKDAPDRLPEMFYNMPVKAQNAILSTFFRDMQSPEDSRIIKDIQEAIEAFAVISGASEQFREAKDVKVARAAVKDVQKQTQLFGNTETVSEKYSNFALELAILFKGARQNTIRDYFNAYYDAVQGKGATLFEQAAKKSKSKAIKDIFGIDINQNDNENGTEGEGSLEGGTGNGPSGQRGDAGNNSNGKPAERGTGPAVDTGGAEDVGGENPPSGGVATAREQYIAEHPLTEADIDASEASKMRKTLAKKYLNGTDESELAKAAYTSIYNKKAAATPSQPTGQTKPAGEVKPKTETPAGTAPNGAGTATQNAAQAAAQAKVNAVLAKLKKHGKKNDTLQDRSLGSGIPDVPSKSLQERIEQCVKWLEEIAKETGSKIGAKKLYALKTIEDINALIAAYPEHMALIRDHINGLLHDWQVLGAYVPELDMVIMFPSHAAINGQTKEQMRGTYYHENVHPILEKMTAEEVAEIAKSIEAWNPLIGDYVDNAYPNASQELRNEEIVCRAFNYLIENFGEDAILEGRFDIGETNNNNINNITNQLQNYGQSNRAAVTAAARRVADGIRRIGQRRKGNRGQEKDEGIDAYRIESLTPEQIDDMLELVEAGAELGYTLLDGVQSKEDWMGQMRDMIGEQLKDATGYTDSEVDELLEDLWNAPYENEWGDTMTIKEHAAEKGIVTNNENEENNGEEEGNGDAGGSQEDVPGGNTVGGASEGGTVEGGNNGANSEPGGETGFGPLFGGTGSGTEKPGKANRGGQRAGATGESGGPSTGTGERGKSRNNGRERPVGANEGGGIEQGGTVATIPESGIVIGSSEQKPKENLADITQEKSPYQPASTTDKKHEIGSVVPTGIVNSIANAFKRLKEKFFPKKNTLDFVREELGYKTNEEMLSNNDGSKDTGLAAEQVDAVALAIGKMKEGKSFIVGDMTGVGKGRTAAALIRWGKLHGKKVLFVTAKPSLYSSMYNDLQDIGSEYMPFCLNGGDPDSNITDTDGKVIYKHPNASAQNALWKQDSDELPRDKNGRQYDLIMTTYDQVSSATTASARQKLEWLQNYAKDAIVIMDESHNASGNSNRGSFFQEIVRAASGVTFLSATYAKRPDNMLLYAIKSSMSNLNMSVGDLLRAIKDYGVAMQELMASALFESGEMIRRERDMSDVKVVWTDPKELYTEEEYEQCRKTSDKTMSLVNDIIQFQRDYIYPIVKEHQEEYELQNKAAALTGGPQVKVLSTPYKGQVSNIVRLMTYTMKAKKAAEMAIDQIKHGKRPIITVDNTLEAYTKDLGDEINDLGFKPVFDRGVQFALKYTITQFQINDEGKKDILFQQTLDAEDELNDDGKRALAGLRQRIEDYMADNDKVDLTLSPIDLVRHMIEDAGYRCGEITGRSYQLERNDKGGYNKVPYKAKKKEVARRFNGGTKKNALPESEQYQAMILNRSGGTGANMHASKTFGNRDPRTMIILQPAQDVNDEQQIRGRVDRTGQEHRAEYYYITSPIPAEQKLTMMLKKKLSSLDAQTTGTKDVSSNKVDSQDMDNKYGNQVCYEYLLEHLLDVNAYLENGQLEFKKGVWVAPSDLLYKVLQDIQRLPCDLQEKVISELTQRYSDAIEYLNQNGINDLETTAMNLEAETIDKATFIKGKDNNSENELEHDTSIERVEVNVLKKPMRSSDIKKKMKDLNALDEDGIPKEGVLGQTEKIVDEKVAELWDARQKKYDEQEQKLLEKIKKEHPKKEGQTDEEWEQMVNNWPSLLEMVNKHVADLQQYGADLQKQKNSVYKAAMYLKPGRPYLVPLTDDISGDSPMMYGRFLGFQMKNGDPRQVQAVFAVKDSRAMISIPVVNKSKVIDRILQERNDLEIVALQQDKWGDELPMEEKAKKWDEWWDKMIPKNTSRQIRFMITGNVVQACGSLGKYKGQIITFTRRNKQTGEVTLERGMLLAENFDPEDFKVRRAVEKKDVWESYGEVKDDRSQISCHRDGSNMVVKFEKRKGEKLVDHPAQKDDELKKLAMNGEIRPSGKNAILCVIKEANVEKALEHLHKEYGYTKEELFVMPDSTEKPDAITRTNRPYQDIINDFSGKYGLSYWTVDNKIKQMLKRYKMDVNNEGLKNDIREAVQLRQAYLRKQYAGQDSNRLAWQVLIQDEQIERHKEDKEDREYNMRVKEAILEELEYRGFKGNAYHYTQGKITLDDVRKMFDKMNDASTAEGKAKKVMFDKVMEKVSKLPMEIFMNEKIDNSTGGFAGGKVVNYNWKYMNADYISDQAKADTILHELIHTVTAYADRCVEDGLDHLLDTEMVDAINELHKILDVIKDDPTFVHDGVNDYGLTNVREMLSEAGSNTQFREDLKKTNLWMKIWSGILKFFGIKQNVQGARKVNAFDVTMERLNYLIDNFNQQAWEDYYKGTQFGGYGYKKMDAQKNAPQEQESYDPMDAVRKAARQFKERHSEKEDPMDAVRKAAAAFHRERNDDSPLAYSAKKVYDERLNTVETMFSEAYQDAMISLKHGQNAIAGDEDIPDSQNAYMAENLMHGKNKNEQDLYNIEFRDPLINTINKILDVTGMNWGDVDRYVYTKHGFERNREFFVRDWLEKERNKADADLEKLNEIESGWLAAKQDYDQVPFPEYIARLDDFIKKNISKKYIPEEHDYSGFRAMFGDENGEYDESEIMDELLKTEDRINKEDGLLDTLWEQIRNATRYGLERYREAGMRSDEQIDRVEQMFHWYVPLRGFKEDMGEDMYQYFTGRGNTKQYLGGLLKHAKGRGSEAEYPISTIFSMTYKAIADCNQNLVNQKFYRLCQAHPNDLVVISDSWAVAVERGDSEDVIWEEAWPEIPDDATEEEVRQITLDFEEQMKELAKEGKAKKITGKARLDYVPIDKSKKSEHIVEARINGQPKHMTVVGNPRMAQALNGQLRFERGKNWASNWNTFIKNKMASLFTSYSVTFALRNMLRDWTHFRMMTATREGAGYSMAAGRYYRKSLFKMYGLFKKYREGTLNMNNEMERDFKDFMDNGGVTGFVQMQKVDDIQKEMEKLYKQQKAGKAVHLNDKVWDKVLGAIEAFNEAIENNARFATYRASRHYAGRTRARSAYDAKEITANFNKKGAGMKTSGFKSHKRATFHDKMVEDAAKVFGGTSQVLGEGRLFFNATVQAIATTFKNFHNPDGSLNKDYIAKWAARFALPPFMLGLLLPMINKMLYAAMGGGDDDPYANLPEWTRRKNICLYIGHNSFLTIPVGQELAAFLGLGDIVAGQTYDPDLKPVDKTPVEEMVDVMNTFSPVDVGTKITKGGLMENPFSEVIGRTFSVLAPIIAVEQNIGWTGRPIYREDTYPNDKYTPEYQMVYSGTNPVVAEALKKLHELGGGDDVTRGKLEVNPGIVQYLWEQYTGGPGKFLANTISLGKDAKDLLSGDEPEFNIRKVEGLKAFIQQGDDRTAYYRANAKWRKYKEDADKLHYELKGYKDLAEEDPVAALRLEEIGNGVEYERMGLVRKAETLLRKMNQAANQAEGKERRELRQAYNKAVKEIVDELDKMGDE